jgi:hypothetical protein
VKAEKRTTSECNLALARLRRLLLQVLLVCRRIPMLLLLLSNSEPGKMVSNNISHCRQGRRTYMVGMYSPGNALAVYLMSIHFCRLQHLPADAKDKTEGQLYFSHITVSGDNTLLNASANTHASQGFVTGEANLLFLCIV